MDEDVITTRCFTLPRSAYERYVAALWLKRRWWIVVVPVVAAGAAAVALGDIRWLIVALMYLCIIVPGIVSMAYFKYLLTPEARLSALPKSLEIIPGTVIKIHYSLPEHLSRVEVEGDDDEKYWLPADEAIKWDSVLAIKISGSNYAIELKPQPHPRFLLVPRKVLSRQLPFELLSI